MKPSIKVIGKARSKINNVSVLSSFKSLKSIGKVEVALDVGPNCAYHFSIHVPSGLPVEAVEMRQQQHQSEEETQFYPHFTLIL